MNPRIINFIRDLRSVALRDASFTRIRAALSEYADMHPAVAHVPASSMLSPYLAFFRTRGTLYAGALVLFIIVSGGGVVGGAEKAIPGDALYAVKINVNEKVAGTFADTAHEKAELSAKLATRRADEALVLLAAGRLDEETATYLEEELTAHVEESNQAATELEIEGDVAASLAVRTELGEELALRAASVAPPVAEAATMKAALFMATDDAVAEEAPTDPSAVIAGALRVQAEKVAEARNHTAAALLPGIGADVDLTVLSATEPAVDVDAATTDLMLNASTTADEAPETMNAKQAPSQGGAWPEQKSFWFNQGR